MFQSYGETRYVAPWQLTLLTIWIPISHNFGQKGENTFRIHNYVEWKLENILYEFRNTLLIWIAFIFFVVWVCDGKPSGLHTIVLFDTILC